MGISLSVWNIISGFLNWENVPEFSTSDASHSPTFDQGNLESLRMHLCNVKPPGGSGEFINILLFGLVGAGKSATINTFLSALDPSGKTMNCVPTGNNPDSLTPKLKSYKSNSLKFWDTAGWNALQDAEKTKKILVMILEGRVPNGTNLKDFNPDSDGAKNPVVPENVIHAVAFIFNTFSMDNLSLITMQQFQNLKTLVTEKNICRFVIGTNCDNLGISESDYHHIYEFKRLQEKFEKLSEQTGMEKRIMFTVSNQWKGETIEKTQCVLALYALKNMVENLSQDRRMAKHAPPEFSKMEAIHQLSINQDKLESLRKHLCNVKPPSGCGDFINILLFGLMGVGKSATINTFLSALDPNGKTMNCVPTGENPDSLTPKLKSYKSNSLKFWDTAGWNALQDAEKTKKILMMILEGRVPNGTNLENFNPSSADAQNPVIPENVIHAVIFIFNTFTMDNITLATMKKFHDLQTLVAANYVYRIVVGTNIDRLGISESDYHHVYECKQLQEKFANLSESTGMEQRTMFAASNQWKGDTIEETQCFLALYILENMVRNVDQYFTATE
ncbi:uncharacterized protein LOC144508205 [Mustelus asterias]